MMNQNINNQQNSNEVSDERIELECKCAWYKNHAGQPSFDYSEGYDIGFHAGLKHKSNTTTDIIKEVDKFLLDKANSIGISVDFSDKEYDGDKEAPMDRIGFLDYLINDLPSEKDEPIKDEELDKKLHDEIYELIADNIGNIVITPTVKRCIEAAKKYAASKLNNTIEDKWISVENELPKESGRYWCYVEHQTDLGLSHFQWNCSYNETGKTFSDKYLTDGERVTHWQPLPKAPNQ